MIDHCEFPYADDSFGWLSGGGGFLLLMLTFAVGVGLGVLVASLLSRRSGPDGLVEEKWKTVQSALLRAQGVSDDLVLARVNEAIHVIERSFGAVMHLGMSMSYYVAHLENAVTIGGAGGHAPADGGPPPDGKVVSHAQNPTGGAISHQEVIEEILTRRIFIIGGRSPAHHPVERKPATLKDYLDHARDQAKAFLEYWRKDTARIDDLRRVRREFVR